LVGKLLSAVSEGRTMSVVTQFVLSVDDFVLGDALQDDGIEHIDVACTVPTRIGAMPYIWVWGSSFDGFEETVRDDSGICDVTVIDSLEASRLYRVEWETADPTDPRRVVPACAVEIGFGSFYSVHGGRAPA
jgi:hypothetical protein